MQRLVLAAFVIGIVNAVFVRSPIQATKQRNASLSQISFKDRAQIPLTKDIRVQNDGKTRLPLDTRYRLFFNFLQTNISIGNPPQHFTVALDTGYAAPLLVPGVRCLDSALGGCKDDGRWTSVYDSSASETYQLLDTPSTSEWAFYEYNGVLSKDEVSIGDLRVPQALFHEWQRQHCLVWLICVTPPAVLGLAPPWTQTQSAPGILELMVADDVLDKAMFSLRLPNAHDEQGELVFGASEPPNNTEEAVVIPIQPGNHNPYWPAAWPIQFDGMAFNGSEFRADSPGLSASIESAYPGIILPYSWASQINEFIGARRQSEHDLLAVIPCEKRGKLPPLALVLGPKNRTIVVSSHEYIQAIPRPDDNAPPFCVSMLEDSSYFDFGDTTVVFGSAFLNNFYTTFDLEKRSISFARLRYNN